MGIYAHRLISSAVVHTSNFNQQFQASSRSGWLIETPKMSLFCQNANTPSGLIPISAIFMAYLAPCKNPYFCYYKFFMLQCAVYTQLNDIETV